MIIICVKLQIRHNKPRLEHPLRRDFPVHDAVHVIRFKHPTVHLRKALAERSVGPRVETVGVRQVDAHIQAAGPYAGGNALHARVVVLGVSPVGQHHV